MPALAVTSAFVPLAVLVLWTVFAGPASQASEATASQLRDSSQYITAVLGDPAEEN